MRSACQGTADVLVVMDVGHLTFTLNDLAEVDGPGSVVLCATHLGRLVEPVGWKLVDARGGGELISLEERRLASAMAEEEAAETSNGSVGVEGESDPADRMPPMRPVAAVHPLQAARIAREADRVSRQDASVTADAPDSEETPLLARAFLGVNRHPSATRNSEDPSNENSEDPFGEHHWDQRDLLEEGEFEPAVDDDLEDSILVHQDHGEQLTFGGEPGA